MKLTQKLFLKNIISSSFSNTQFVLKKEFKNTTRKTKEKPIFHLEKLSFLLNKVNAMIGLFLAKILLLFSI